MLYVYICIKGGNAGLRKYKKIKFRILIAHCRSIIRIPSEKTVYRFTVEFYKVYSSMLKTVPLHFSFSRAFGNFFKMTKWQTKKISGETARYELSHPNLHCLQ